LEKRFSMLSSLRDDFNAEECIQPHYKESYRMAIDRLVSGDRDSYLEFLKGERIGSFLSEEELAFISANVEQLPPQNHTEEICDPQENKSSSGTYWPMYSDTDAPDLDLGWPEIFPDTRQTNIDLLFHPPRQNSPTIKEVVRKNIQEARQVISIVMDVFTDVDIFKEVVSASLRGVPVYILLDDYHVKSFLTMAENQDVNIRQLRNMRVRTVKGLNYLCKSGATFHGTMQQRFLLVDCLTAIYGSYSFTWSSEKINLNMIQVITGHLVKSFDEEFRTLYARSSAPADLCPLDGSLLQKLPKSDKKIDRKDLLRHTLDTVCGKTFGRAMAARENNHRLLKEERNEVGHLIKNEFCVPTPASHLLSAAPVDLKRHSYAGKVQDGYTQLNICPRGSNWNIYQETGRAVNKNLTNNNLCLPQRSRGQNALHFSHGEQAVNMLQTPPTLDNKSRACMRTLRIESYLQTNDFPLQDSWDYLDEYEQMDKSSRIMQGRMRASLVFRPNVQEQMEPNRHMNHIGLRPSAVPNSPLHYSSMQWNPMMTESHISNEEFLMKRQSLQILDNRDGASYGQGRNMYPPGYASLGRAKGGPMIANPDALMENWHKRHSMADPRSNTEYRHDFSGNIYEDYARTHGNRSATGLNAQNGQYQSNLNEEQRSVSHYDVKGITNSPDIWQDPPSRTVSAAALHANNTDLIPMSNIAASEHLLKKSSKKIKSLLNIPEKKEEVGMAESFSTRSASSTATITAEDESPESRGRHQKRSKSLRSSLKQRGKWRDDFKSCKPQSEDRHGPKKHSFHKKSTRTESWSKDCSTDDTSQPYSSTEKRPSLGADHSQNNSKSLAKGAPEVELKLRERGHHENKLERFIQRMGNLIYKNK
uniref:Family with sequence similarity 83 member B n=1 Tax=Takifugu rubripes TaxID=31033 RepID=A0A3B5K4A2_TAKRU